MKDEDYCITTQSDKSNSGKIQSYGEDKDEDDDADDDVDNDVDDDTVRTRVIYCDADLTDCSIDRDHDWVHLHKHAAAWL